MPGDQGGFGGAESWETAVSKGKSGVGEMVVRVCIVCIDDMIDDIDIDRYCIGVCSAALHTVVKKLISCYRFAEKMAVCIGVYKNCSVYRCV